MNHEVMTCDLITYEKMKSITRYLIISSHWSKYVKHGKSDFLFYFSQESHHSADYGQVELHNVQWTECSDLKYCFWCESRATIADIITAKNRQDIGDEREVSSRFFFLPMNKLTSPKRIAELLWYPPRNEWSLDSQMQRWISVAAQQPVRIESSMSNEIDHFHLIQRTMQLSKLKSRYALDHMETRLHEKSW
jgi:hypothetical protein